MSNEERVCELEDKFVSLNAETKKLESLIERLESEGMVEFVEVRVARLEALVAEKNEVKNELKKLYSIN